MWAATHKYTFVANTRVHNNLYIYTYCRAVSWNYRRRVCVVSGRGQRKRIERISQYPREDNVEKDGWSCALHVSTYLVQGDDCAESEAVGFRFLKPYPRRYRAERFVLDWGTRIFSWTPSDEMYRIVVRSWKKKNCTRVPECVPGGRGKLRQVDVV